MARHQSRRSFLKTTAILASGRSVPALAQPGSRPTQPTLAYVGSFTGAVGKNGDGEGIYLFSMNPSTGALTQIKVAAKIPSPTWLAIHQGKYLYAANVTANLNGKSAGSVSAFSVNRVTGDLTALNVVSSRGSGPPHLSIHPSGKYVLVANYETGNVAVLPIRPDGSLSDATDVQADAGPAGSVRAQDALPGSFAISDHDGPHPHMIQADPAGRFVFTADLGLDRIFIWEFDAVSGKLSPNNPAYVSLSPGAGPRHFLFHPNGRFFYSLQEEASTIVLFDYDAKHGTLTQRQMISTLPAAFAGTNFTSEIGMWRDGRFVYVANRLHDSIAIFAVDHTGRLTLIDEVWTRGNYPRHFAIDPSGKFLFCCNHRGDSITTFRVERDGAKLTFTGQYTPVGSPAIIVFLT